MAAFPAMLTHLCQEGFTEGSVAVATVHLVDVAKVPGIDVDIAFPPQDLCKYWCD